MEKSSHRQRNHFALGTVLWLVAVSLALSGTAPAAAQTSDIYDLRWSSIDGGGGMSSIGGDYTLSGTIGQNDAGAAIGGNYRLAGGFWGDAASNGSLLYLPLIQKH